MLHIEYYRMSSASATTITGCVKWFNNKAGYGFITAGEQNPSDIFVHHSAIQVGASQYKYLVQGEYVDFTIVQTEGEKHEVQAANVHGVRGGKLMCETRNEMRNTREEQQQPQVSRQKQTQTQQYRAASRPPQLSQSDQTEWMIVPRRKTTTTNSASGSGSASGNKRPQQRQPRVELAGTGN